MIEYKIARKFNRVIVKPTFSNVDWAARSRIVLVILVKDGEWYEPEICLLIL